MNNYTKKNTQLIRSLILALHLSVVAVAWIFSYYIRFYSSLIPINGEIPPFTQYLNFMIILLPVWAIIFHTLNGYIITLSSRSKLSEISYLLKISTVSVLALSATTFIFREHSYSRVVVIVFWFISILFCGFANNLFKKIVNSLRQKGFDVQRVLIIGTGDMGGTLAEKVKNHPELGINIIGFLKDQADKTKDFYKDIPVLGHIEDAKRIVAETSPDEIFIALSLGAHKKLEKVIHTLDDEIVNVRVLPDLYRFMNFNNSVVDNLDRLPLVSISQEDSWGLERSIKRTLDIVGSLLGIIFSSPMMLFTAIAIKLTSSGDLLNTSEQTGPDGKSFNIYKFRTVMGNAEGETKTGMFLRKTGCYNLPVFFNVLKGDMSLVGPMPAVQTYAMDLIRCLPPYKKKHTLKAGMTGWAKVNNHKVKSNTDKRTYDLFYIENWSFLLDVLILCLMVWNKIVNRVSRDYAWTEILLTFSTLLGLFFVFFGGVQGDEGWNLYASREVYNGRFLYRDFSYHGAPMLPYFYGFFQWITVPGMISGRVISLVLLLLIEIFTLKIIQKKKLGEMGVLIGVGFLAVNSYSLYFLIIVKTFVLPLFFLIFSVYLIICYKHSTLKNILVILLVCCAPLSRISMLPAVGCIVLYLLIEAESLMERITYLLTTVTIAMSVIGFFYLNNSLEHAYYFNFTYYTDLHTKISPTAFMIKKIKQILTINDKFFSFAVVAAILVYLNIYLSRSTERFFAIIKNFLSDKKNLLILSIIFLVTVAHFLPKETLREYHIMLLPLVGIAFAELTVASLRDRKFIKGTREYLQIKAIIIVVLFTTLFTGYSKVWIIGGYPTITISQVGKYLASISTPDTKIISYKSEILVEADRNPIPKTEMFDNFVMETWDKEMCDKFNSLNLDMVEDMLAASEPDIIVLYAAHTGRRSFKKPSSVRKYPKEKSESLNALFTKNYVLDKEFASQPFTDRVYLVYVRRPVDSQS